MRFEDFVTGMSYFPNHLFQMFGFRVAFPQSISNTQHTTCYGFRHISKPSYNKRNLSDSLNAHTQPMSRARSSVLLSKTCSSCP